MATAVKISFSHTTESHAKPTMQPDLYYINTANQYHHSTKKSEYTAHMKFSLDKYKNNSGKIHPPPPPPPQKKKKKKHAGRVGGAGQAMAEGNKNNWTLKRHVTWRPPHTRTHTPSRVWEKRFPLLSFLSQRKTTWHF